MLRALQLLNLPEELLERLRGAKSERDRLAYRFFREHDEDFLSRTGRTKMIAKCEQAIEMLSATDVDLEKQMRPQRERHGITDAWIERHLAAALAAASAHDSANSDPDRSAPKGDCPSNE